MQHTVVPRHHRRRDRIARRPGNYTLSVSAVLTEDVTGEGEALGRVRLVAAGNTLPATGTTVTWVTSIVAGIAVLLGLVTLLGSRRREAPR